METYEIVNQQHHKVFLKAMDNFYQGYFSESLDRFKYCIQNYYHVRDSYFYLGMHKYFVLNYKEALYYFQIVISGGDHSGAYYFLGLLYYNFDNTSLSVEYFKKSINVMTDHFYPFLALLAIQPHIEEQEYKIYYEKLYKGFSIQIQIPINQQLCLDAFKYWSNKDYTQSILCLLEAKNKDPNNFFIYYLLAQLYFKIEDYRQSEILWKTIHKQFDLDRLGLKELIQIYKSQKYYYKSIKLLKRYISLSDSINYKDYHNLGVLYNLSGQVKMAIPCYNKAISFNKFFFPSLLNLAINYHKIRDYNKAIHTYKQALGLNTSESIVYYNLGLSYFEQKHYFLALFYLKESFMLNPSFVEAKNNFSYISLLHMHIDKEFTHKSHLLLLVSIGFIIILIVLIISLNFFKVI